MTTPYTPKPGTNAARVIEALQAGPLTRTQVAKIIGCTTDRIDPMLLAPLKHGLIVRTRIGKAAGLALATRSDGFVEAHAPQDAPTVSPEPADAEPAEESAPVFSARLYDDGELEIFGAQPVEQDGHEGFRLTAEQVCKLVRLASGCVVPA